MKSSTANLRLPGLPSARLSAKAKLILAAIKYVYDHSAIAETFTNENHNGNGLYVEPVIWNCRTGNVVGGHQRLKVLVDMGQAEIDCVVVDLDLRREKALNIALNKIQGDWDEEKLASLMAEFDAADFDVSLTGFEASEVDALLNRFYSHEAQEDEFDADAAQEKITENGGPVTQPGSLWALGEHRLLCAAPTGPEAYRGGGLLAGCRPDADGQPVCGTSGHARHEAVRG